MNPHAFLPQVSSQLDTLRTRAQFEPVLDEFEYLIEILNLELHAPATGSIEMSGGRIGQSK